MPRFVVLFHEFPKEHVRDSHWDLMLEDAECLLTWELVRTPESAMNGQACKQLADHRLEYLSYQGPVSQDRGHVTQWDAGNFIWVSRAEKVLKVRLDGQQLQGMAFLELRESDWYFRFEARKSEDS